MLEEKLYTHFGYNEFRQGQKEIIEKIIDKKNVLGILPTGAGKSLSYQLPAILLPGITLVITPLISLMEDQVYQLRHSGLRIATLINSSTASGDYKLKLIRLRQGKYKILYISPEKLQQEFFFKELKGLNISLVVIDEAHCISQWGHDFRPDYLKIREVIPKLNNPIVVALTATATPMVQADIIKQLNLSNIETVHTSHDRENIAYQVIHAANLSDKKNTLKNTVLNLAGPGIIYVNSRKSSEEMTEFLRGQGITSVEAYHAGLPYDDRAIIQQQFMQGEVALIVATKAFGMGINKKNVRYVIHFDLPANIESYMQEVGRVGRDGQQGYALLLYQEGDEALVLRLIEQEYPTEALIQNVLYYLFNKKQKYFTFSLEELKYSEINDQLLELIFFYLERNGYIKWKKLQQGYEITILLELNLANGTALLNQIFERRKEHRKKELKEMLQFIQNNSCRRENLLKYFSESLYKRPNQCCDYCGIDFSIFQKRRDIVTNSSAKLEWNWKEELTKLLPIGEKNDER